jgi:hypothetical protein
MSSSTWDAWYEKNKEELNRRRREKYRKNKKFKKQCQTRSSKYYHAVVKPKKGKVNRRVIRTSKGDSYLTIGAFAKTVGRNPSTIRNMQAAGTLPEPSACDSRGWRLYTVSQARLLKKLFVLYDDKKITRKQLKKLIVKHWR